MSGKIIIKNQPCLNEKCGSSDARQIYDDETSFCFSCKMFFDKTDGDLEAALEREKAKEKPRTSLLYAGQMTIPEIQKLSMRGFKERKILKPTCEFYKVYSAFNTEGQISAHYYPYDNGQSYKERKLPKNFHWIPAASSGLFGQELFPKGGKRVILCEGEIDTLTMAQCVFEKNNRYYPVVGLSSSAMVKSVLEQREWLRSFGEVILALDMDEAGQKATIAIARIIGYDKVKICKFPENDVNDTYLMHGGTAVMLATYDAQPYVPAGIIETKKLRQQLIEFNNKIALPYPPCLDGLNTKLKGKRGGEITLFISGTGSGKSTLLREDAKFTLENTPEEVKIGVISLEESPPEYAKKLAGMQINKNPAKEEIPIEEILAGFDVLFGSDRIVLLDHQGSVSDGSLLDQVEFMMLSGCLYIYIDHLTLAVSEGDGKTSGNEAQDKFMSDLLKLVKRYPDCWVGLVSHLRKSVPSATPFEEGRIPSMDDIKGSGSVKQISFDIIGFARNMVATDETEKNTIKMRVLKARTTSLTGDVRGARYDYDTGRLFIQEDEPEEDFTEINVKG